MPPFTNPQRVLAPPFADPSAGGEVLSTPAPLFPIMHNPPLPNHSTPPRGAFPRRSPVRVIVPAVSPVVPILLGCPPFVVQFARKSLVKWTKGAVWNLVLPSLCPLRPAFPSTRGRESGGRIGGGWPNQPWKCLLWSSRSGTSWCSDSRT